MKPSGLNKFRPLSQLKEELDKCMKCGFCRELCPAAGLHGWEANSPRGRIQLLKALLEGELPDASNYLIERIYFCMTCSYCFHRCPAGARTWEAFEAARAMLKNWGKAPGGCAKPVSNILSFGNPFGEPLEAKGDWLPSGVEPSGEAEILYWAGCAYAYRLKEEAAAMARILDAAGLKFAILGADEGDCGSLLIRLGYWEEAKKVAEENKAKVRKVGARILATPCPACFKTFAEDYPKLLGVDLTKDLGLRLLHSSQLFEELIAKGKISPSKLSLKLAYHDPCYLGRHLNVYEPPRKVLKSIPGIKLKEHPKSRWLSSCCGAGGSSSFRFLHEAEAVKQASKRVKQFKELGVEAAATACPFCTLNLRDGAKALGEEIEIYDLSTLLFKALG
ncbi:TPA: (Fe-S)-binding protein [Candidatus Bathyarchaeota archaeon]|nr:(Fe-S)-binding protein [Candidatus Bathyarchaeota archaeon]